jgi:hypothetical protein
MSISTSIDPKPDNNSLQSFSQLSAAFVEKFAKRHFPAERRQLYDASQY